MTAHRAASLLRNLIASASFAVRGRYHVRNQDGRPLTNEQEGAVEWFLEEGPAALLDQANAEWTQTLGPANGILPDAVHGPETLRVFAGRIGRQPAEIRDCANGVCEVQVGGALGRHFTLHGGRAVYGRDYTVRLAKAAAAAVAREMERIEEEERAENRARAAYRASPEGRRAAMLFGLRYCLGSAGQRLALALNPTPFRVLPGPASSLPSTEP